MLGWIDPLHSPAIYPDSFRYVLLSAQGSNLKDVCPNLWLSPKHKKVKYSEISGMPNAAVAGTQASELWVCSQTDGYEHK